MPRRPRRRLVPITTLIACALPCAGASAAPVPADPPLPRDQVRAERSARLATVMALVERKEVRRSARVAQAREAGGVIAAVRSQLGDSYAYGASGPDGFDCSGLTMYAFGRAGIALPHNSQAQAGMGRAVDRADIRPGDLVFFSTAGPGASHVGIATSTTTAISATSSRGVMEHSTTDGAAYVTARRLS